MSLVTVKASSELKMTACTSVESRAAFTETTIATGIKADGSVKHSLVEWMLQTVYNSVGKIVNFSLSFKETQNNKNKGFFVEVARLTPTKKTGLTLQFFTNSRLSQEKIKVAALKFVNLENAKNSVDRGELPRHFYLLATVFDQANIQHSSDAEQLSTIAPIADQVWNQAESTLPQIFPAFYGLTAIGALPVSQPQTIEHDAIDVETVTESKLEDLTKSELIQRLTDLEIPFSKSMGKSELLALFNV